MATTKITNPELFDLGSLNTALQLPSGTTAERPTSPSTGEWRYNTTTNLIEFWDGGAWRDLQSENIPPVPSEHFNTVLYNGTSATQSITGVGFQPDFVWIKRRDGTENHYWQDSSRGSTQQIYSNLTNAQFNETTAVTSFDSDGFTMGSYNGINNSGETYVAWCWKLNGGTTSTNTDGSITSTVQVNTKAGISIVQYTGTQANATVGHGLGVAPSLVITKALGAVNGWPTLVQADSTTRYDGLRLNEAGLNNSGNGAGFFQNTSPTDSVFSLGNSDESNRNATATIAYCFAEVAGFSSIGGYSGNGSDNGPIINTGFEPAWLMIKVVTGSADGWFMVDNKRDTSNPRAVRVFANSDVGDAEEPGAQVDFLTNGFQLRGSGGGQGQTNKSGSTYVYIAFASDPSTAPVLADSFNTTLYTGNGSATARNIATGFKPDFMWIKGRDTAGKWNVIYDTLRGPTNMIATNSTAASQTYGSVTSYSDGFTLETTAGDLNTNGENYVSWNWKANSIPTINTDGTIQSIVSANQAAGISIVKYTGDGSASSTVGHGLGVIPDLTIFKSSSTSDFWHVFDTANNTVMFLNATTAAAAISGGTNGAVDIANMSSTTFGFLQGSSSVNNQNGSGTTYIVYAFKSISGFSKIGSYTGTGTGTNQLINTGFASSWVMIKDSSAGGSWFVIDSERGGSKSLKANTSDAESTTNYITFESNGFRVAGDANATSTWLYLSFKENPTPYPLAGNMSFLVVAGGGGGGYWMGAGGGAGGLRTSYGSTSGGGASSESDITLAAGTYTITVGAAGSGMPSGGTTLASAGNGGDSSIAASGLTTITSNGGGGGGAYALLQPSNAVASGANGGSGGGAWSISNQGQSAGTGTAGQGYAGALGGNQTSAYGEGTGGGGGASAAGTQGINGARPNGGAGLSVSITGSAVDYAGGGGGATTCASPNNATNGGLGGTGGGGNGGYCSAGNDNGGNGTTNTGGGGGGSSAVGTPASTGGTAGNGGSGVVILRLATSEYSGTTTGSPTVTTDGDYTILTYTGSGTYVHS